MTGLGGPVFVEQCTEPLVYSVQKIWEKKPAMMLAVLTEKLPTCFQILAYGERNVVWGFA
jgi:hypothetical protein